MKLRPGQHEPELPAGKRAVDHFEIVDANLGLAVGVASMEVGKSVVIEEHRDGDAEEATDRRHDAMMGRSPDTIKD